MPKTITIANNKIIVNDGETVKVYGGAGSGFHGHAGRPGMVGGSSGGGGGRGRKSVSKEKSLPKEKLKQDVSGIEQRRGHISNFKDKFTQEKMLADIKKTTGYTDADSAKALAAINFYSEKGYSDIRQGKAKAEA